MGVWYPQRWGIETAMPSQEELKWSQLKVSVLVVVSLAALTGLIFVMSGSTGGLFSRKIRLRSYFENANGLKVGAPVTLDGVTIGTVIGVNILPHHEPNSVEVICRVGANFLPSLHTDSTVAIDQAGVLGDSFVDISSATARGPEPGDYAVLPGASAPGIPEVMRTSRQTLAETSDVLEKIGATVDTINHGHGTAGLLLNDPQTAKNLSRMLTELEALTQQISSGKGSLGKLIADDQLYNRANDTITKLDDIATRLDNGEGTAGKLLHDDSLYQNLNQAAANTNSLLAQINAGHGALGKLARDPALAKKLQVSIGQMDSLLKNINDGKGSLGQLAVNPALYNHADQAMSEGGSLVTELRRNPKKYLTVHVKLF